MSDRVTNAEVEDVLSSIRRLVSDDNRIVQARKAVDPDASPPVRRRPVTERLVLTPALRVADPATVQLTDAKAPVTTDPATLVLSTDTTGTDDQSVDASAERIALVEKPPVQTDEQIADALAEDYSTDPYGFDDKAETGQDKPASVNEAVPHQEDGGTEEAVFEGILGDDDKVQTPAVEAESQNQTTPDVQPEADAKAAALNAKIAALETAIGKITDRWEPDDLGQSDYAGTAPQEMTWEDEEAEPKPFLRPTLAPVMRKVQEPESAEDFSAAKGADDAPSQDIEPTPQEFFTSRKSPPKAIVGSAAEILQEPVHSVEERTVKNLKVEPVFEQESAGAPSQDEAMLADGDQLLDEDALREMIGDIVRSELQGALGERITRNVRKLVRREIHRALTAQELE